MKLILQVLDEIRIQVQEVNQILVQEIQIQEMVQHQVLQSQVLLAQMVQHQVVLQVKMEHQEELEEELKVI